MNGIEKDLAEFSKYSIFELLQLLWSYYAQIMIIGCIIKKFLLFICTMYIAMHKFVLKSGKITCQIFISLEIKLNSKWDFSGLDFVVMKKT